LNLRVQGCTAESRIQTSVVLGNVTCCIPDLDHLRINNQLKLLASSPLNLTLHEVTNPCRENGRKKQNGKERNGRPTGSPAACSIISRYTYQSKSSQIRTEGSSIQLVRSRRTCNNSWKGKGCVRALTDRSVVHQLTRSLEETRVSFRIGLVVCAYVCVQ